MTVGTQLPPVNSLVYGDRIASVHPHKLGDWLIVAHVDVPQPANSGRTVAGKIPIDEVSPYADFDPAKMLRSWALRREVCDLFLRNCDKRFAVLAHREGELILSLRRATLAQTSVSRNDHGSHSYVVRGFHHLRSLHFHVLKHPLGLGGGATRWPATFQGLRQSILGRLRQEGCPAAERFDGKLLLLGSRNPCASCPFRRLLRCFDILAPVRHAYEREAASCILEASDPLNPRHYHFSEVVAGRRRRKVLVFLDSQCRKAVAKSGPASQFSAATFYPVQDCDPYASNDRLRYLGERRRIAAVFGSYGNVKICIPPSFGF